MKKWLKSSLGVCWVMGVFLIVACGGSSKDSSEIIAKSDYVNNYSDVVLATYQDTLGSAKKLQLAVDAFVADPSEANHQAAKDAWLLSRESYGQTETFRFYGGPIDNEVNGPEGFINAWPLDEGHIDYVVGAAGTNIINDTVTYPTLDKNVIENLNEEGGEKNVSSGYHAIEFLLWGQDTNLNGPGERSFTDYVTTGTGTNDNQLRRGQYLKIVTDALVEHLEFLVNQWVEGDSSNFRTQFLALNPDDALKNAFTGMEELSLGELASERMNVGLQNHDQEDEHSCFSDNTHRDIVNNGLGMQNIFLGTYKDLSGVIHGNSSLGLYQILLQTDSGKAEALKAQFTETMTKLNAIQAPFDLEISSTNPEGNARVEAGIVSLTKLNTLITDAMVTLKLK